MTEVAQRQELEQAVPLAALFTAFLAVSLYGVGGASGTVMARAADTSWPAVAVTTAAAVITLATRLSPMWMLLAGGALGGLSLL